MSTGESQDPGESMNSSDMNQQEDQQQRPDSPRPGSPAAPEQDEAGPSDSNEGNYAYGTSAADGGMEPAPAFLVENGARYDVPESTRLAVDGFQPPKGFECFGSREQSFIYSMGAFVRPLDLSINNKGAAFYCQASPQCRASRRPIPCAKGSRSNVNKHYARVHGVTGMKAQVRADIKKREAKSGVGVPSSSSSTGSLGVFNRKTRELEVLYVMMAVEKMLPLSFASSGVCFRQLMEAVCRPFPSMHPRRVKHILLEMYVATKQAMVGHMVEDVQEALLPIVHYVLDLWTCKVSGRKFLGTHVFYIDRLFNHRHVLLSMKHYSPLLEQARTRKGSEALLKVFEATLDEFGLKVSNLASGTTDSESYGVKAMCVSGLAPRGIPWDQCASSAASKACELAFGLGADPAKSRNKLARELLGGLIEVMGRLQKSRAVEDSFDDLQLDLAREMLSLPEPSPRRWLSLTRVLERAIRLWLPLRKLYIDQGEAFPLDGDGIEGILQLYSLMEPISAVTGDGQYGSLPATAEMHMTLGMLKMGALDYAKPLKVFQVPEEQAEGSPFRGLHAPPLRYRMVPAEELLQATTLARRELSAALVAGFYERVWDPNSPDPSFFRDAAVLLTPPFNTGNHLWALRLTASDAPGLPGASSRSVSSGATDDAAVETKLEDAWTGIKSRAIGAWRKQRQRQMEAEAAAAAAAEAEAEAEAAVGEGVPSAKRIRVSVGSSASASSLIPPPPCVDNKYAFFGHGGGGGGDGAKGEPRVPEDEAEVAVRGELKRYKALIMETNEVEPTEVLEYWGTKGKVDFPTLRAVSQQVFGNQASAVRKERDFRAAGILLAQPRSRMDTYWVEIMMFLNANMDRIPENFAEISSSDIHKHVPARFSGDDAGLMEAEAELDPAGEVVPNPEGSMMGLDEQTMASGVEGGGEGRRVSSC